MSQLRKSVPIHSHPRLKNPWGAEVSRQRHFSDLIFLSTSAPNQSANRSIIAFHLQSEICNLQSAINEKAHELSTIPKNPCYAGLRWQRIGPNPTLMNESKNPKTQNIAPLFTSHLSI